MRGSGGTEGAKGTGGTGGPAVPTETAAQGGNVKREAEEKTPQRERWASGWPEREGQTPGEGAGQRVDRDCAYGIVGGGTGPGPGDWAPNADGCRDTDSRPLPKEVIVSEPGSPLLRHLAADCDPWYSGSPHSSSTITRGCPSPGPGPGGPSGETGRYCPSPIGNRTVRSVNGETQKAQHRGSCTDSPSHS